MMEPRHKADLVRGLSLLGAASVVVGTVIGTGVFLKARVMTCNLESPLAVLFVWVAAGLLSLAGALTYAELAAMMPHAGGEYVFIREAYGRRLSFIYGWTQFAIVYPASQAAKAVGFAVFLNVLLGKALEQTYFTYQLFGYSLSFGHLQVVALAIVAVVTALNCAAVAFSGKMMSILTLLKALFVVTIAGGAFFIAKGSFAHFSMSAVVGPGACTDVAASARGGLFGFGAAMLAALWAYDGWANLTIVAGEVKQPQRNLPLALIGGMLLILFLYVTVNAAYFYVLTPTQIASVSLASSVATDVARNFLGPAAVALMAAGLMVSTLGSLYSGILTGARVPFAMSRDGIFFSGLGKISSNARVPVNALLVQWLWINVLTLSGSFDKLTDYAMFAAWIFYGLATYSVFILRKTLPNADRAYKTLGYPIVPIIFVLVTLYLLLNTIWTAPLQSLGGLGLIAFGLPFYWYFSRRTTAAVV